MPMPVTGQQSLPVLTPTHKPLVYFLSPVRLRRAVIEQLCWALASSQGQPTSPALHTSGTDTHKLFNCVQHLAQTHTCAPLLLSYSNNFYSCYMYFISFITSTNKPSNMNFMVCPLFYLPVMF